MTFKETGLKAEILQAIEAMGFESPTPIQEKMIPLILAESRDVIALAQTGTGKTAAFGLPLVEQIDVSSNAVQTLVLCPTRELCIQIAKDLESFSKNIRELKVAPVYGGAPIEKQISALKKGSQIVVGTPGRVNDLIRRKVLKIGEVRWLVLDEADEMLSMGFKDELDAIIEQTPQERQTLLFSATMPDSIAAQYTRKPLEISVGKRNAGAETVAHVYYVVHAKDRYLALKRIVDLHPEIYGIVFCRTRQETKDIAEKLMADGYNADALHGDLSQAQRDYVMNRFRVKNLQILVATDVAARGLDVNDLTHVINYNLPDDIEVYTHRSGRTGRAGRNGTSISIAHTRETGRIRMIEKMINKKFTKKMVPSGREICERQLFHLVDGVENIEVADGQIDLYLPAIIDKLSWLSREDLIKRFVSVEFNRFLAYYKDAKDLNAGHEEKAERRSKRNSRDSSTNFSRFYINAGSKNRLNAHRLIGLINEQTDRNDIEIGKIEIMKKLSFFEIDSQHEQALLNAFKQEVAFEGESIVIEPANSKPTSSSRRDAGRREYGRRDRGEGSFFSKKKAKRNGTQKKKRSY